MSARAVAAPAIPSAKNTKSRSRRIGHRPQTPTPAMSQITAAAVSGYCVCPVKNKAAAGNNNSRLWEQQRRARGLARLQVAMGARRLGERVGLVDLDLHLP